jgi:hypothetical protein
MEALNYLRNDIKSYFAESSELCLSDHFTSFRRFNFYFEIVPGTAYLLYLNWDGEYNRFTLKCLEFEHAALLKGLIDSYPDAGAKVFNVGKPRSTVSFLYRADHVITSLDFRGDIRHYAHHQEITTRQLMECVDPLARQHPAPDEALLDPD